VLFALVFVTAVFGRPLYVIAAEPNDCIQGDYSIAMARHGIVVPDPNVIVGPVLGPVSGDPNAWEVPAGQWKRDWARYCDPQGDDVVIACVGGTNSAEVQIDKQASRWSFAAVVLEGLNCWQFEASDGKDKRVVTVVVWGLKNEPPVLQ